MRATSIAIAAVLSGAAFAQAPVPKPSGGSCECGQYIEAPALCRSLKADQQEPCRKSNAAWFDQCVTWQEQTCQSGMFGAVAKGVKIVASPASLAKFAGTWHGITQCQKQGTWGLMLSVRQKPDGSYVAKAATEGVGEFKKLTIVGDNITLLYSSVFKDTSYIGRLAVPDRIEGTVKIQEECTWRLTR